MLEEQNPSQNFVEITRMHHRMDTKSIISIVVKASKVVPRSCFMYLKEDDFGFIGHAAVVEFKNELEAVKVVDRLKYSIYSKNWQMALIKNPKLENKPPQSINTGALVNQ